MGEQLNLTIDKQLKSREESSQEIPEFKTKITLSKEEKERIVSEIIDDFRDEGFIRGVGGMNADVGDNFWIRSALVLAAAAGHVLLARERGAPAIGASDGGSIAP